jgi:rod shape-determining protein MreD
MRRALVIFATLVLLWAVVSELNHALTPLHIYIWLGGLFVTYSALLLPLKAGLTATLLGGMLCDATAPVAFGTHTLLFAAAHVIILNVRDRVPTDETVVRVTVALVANLSLFLVFSIIQITRLPAPTAVWPRLIFDLICSQIFLAVVAPWFFALQAGALELARPLTTRYGRNTE